jgi:hypothetical protein
MKTKLQSAIRSRQLFDFAQVVLMKEHIRQHNLSLKLDAQYVGRGQEQLSIITGSN